MADHQEIVSTHYPYLAIRLEVQGQSEEAPALLDTGYTDSVIIPDTWHSHGLGLPDGRTAVEVGDGRIVFAPVYLGILDQSIVAQHVHHRNPGFDLCKINPLCHDDSLFIGSISVMAYSQDFSTGSKEKSHSIKSGFQRAPVDPQLLLEFQ